MKNNNPTKFFGQKALAFLICLSILGISSLQAQTTTVTQAMVNTALTSGNPITGVDIEIPTAITVQNSGTASTLTIIATGNVTISANLNLSGAAGQAPSSSTSVQRSGKNGHNLSITADGDVTITGVVNTSGGNAVPPASAGEYASDREAGTGGNAGNVLVNGDKVSISSAINANGGNAASPNTGDGARRGGAGGNAGKVEINSQKDLTINVININGGNGSSNHQARAAGAGGNAGSVEIDSKAHITTTGAITANAGNTGQNPTSGTSDDAIAGVPLSKNGGTIKITSDGVVNIGGAITANGGNGTGQATDIKVGPSSERNQASTDGGDGGSVSVSSCGDLTFTAAITVNGGLAGVPIGSPNGGSTFWNQAGSGGNGGSIVLTSSNDNVTTVQIQANAANGQNATASMGGTNAGNVSPFNGRADHAGWGGNGGTIDISALRGTITVNNNITANAGNGGSNNGTSSCGGSGGNGGTIHLKAATGDASAINPLLAVTGGTKGADIAGNAYQCVDGKVGINGITSVVITPYTPPTLSGTIDVSCDADGNVISQTITRAMLDSYLDNYIVVPSERWEICLDGSTWNAITFPFIITDDNKDDYNGYLRLVYTECAIDKYLEKVLIDIPCLPTPPTPPTPSDCPELPNAIIWGGNQGGNHNFLVGDVEIENLKIFNRHGVTVFTGGKGEGWDGTYKGKAVDPGVYYYVLKHECLGTVKAAIQVVKEK